MSSQRYNSKAIIKLRARFTAAGVAITNATGQIHVVRESDNMFWNNTSWQVARVAVAMTEIDETNFPGEWEYIFDSGDAAHNEIDTYNFEPIDTSGNSDNVIEIFTAFVGGWLDPILLGIQRLLSLAQDNYVMEPTEFSIDDKMTKGIAKGYDSAANATTDDGATGLTGKWNIDAPRSPTTNRLLKFTMTRVL